MAVRRGMDGPRNESQSPSTRAPKGGEQFNRQHSSESQWKSRRPILDLIENSSSIIWNSYLYHLQQAAPSPRAVLCEEEGDSRTHPIYGRVFHGSLGAGKAEKLLGNQEGAYLVRESLSQQGATTLSFRCNGVTKHYHLYYGGGQHYVGGKKFSTLEDLVREGLITLFLEGRGAEQYIDGMYKTADYACSPYQTLNHAKRELILKQINTASNGHVKSKDVEVKDYEKPHSYEMHSFKGFVWCDICGNFLWGLLAQGVRCLDCGLSAHHKCSEKVPNDCLPQLRFLRGVFGVDLTTLVKAYNRPRPFVVDLCVKEIEERGLDVEGLYRVSPSNDELDSLRLTFDEDGESTDLSIYSDIHVVAGLLKLYFRLLPIPLIPYDAYDRILHAIRDEEKDEGEGKRNGKMLLVLRDCVHDFPPAHFHTAKFLMAHLANVAEYCEKNRMTAGNLATVFSPTLMRSPTATPAEGLASVHLEKAVMETFIQHHQQLFS
ncbi:unnamed protein product [Darwinula stevensoni]|uniref:Beta-chimaerin n=1 Tax=Darwinula stevensoni TaxID=69355 RepID=A0A7R9FS74_9CRUS|nr:unnamed protein product [Darwinula stevensoni]CAG0902732.1 unnamed protein product [Darwinula stevensoni]